MDENKLMMIQVPCTCSLFMEAVVFFFELGRYMNIQYMKGSWKNQWWHRFIIRTMLNYIKKIPMLKYQSHTNVLPWFLPVRQHPSTNALMSHLIVFYLISGVSAQEGGFCVRQYIIQIEIGTLCFFCYESIFSTKTISAFVRSESPYSIMNTEYIS